MEALTQKHPEQRTSPYYSAPEHTSLVRKDQSLNLG